ncbi:hypothetical protein [Sporolactobacillus terrae]|uniref:DUF3899 domain-containing protein n=1 Tax=Sporolactobacillus terrae TaxID=269673 RepID=A0ABX5QA03_9BACL|nr:hypothetical protein [Sporolactobacillus terrae]QAA23454.1 hypothetical protein C0674_13075 [Sporolactobacillus terrae]QAA26424.1 hypothetical protein C0679_13060 [Sporolactobacillus terrae]UAK15518.1 hypothetical protein K7399_10690 [Sporolactobacillus terrae]
MAAILLAILLWLIGLFVLSASFFLNAIMRKKADVLLKDAEHEQGKDESVSIAMTIEGKILDRIPSYVIHSVTGVVGLTLIALGVVALAFYFH